MKPITIIIETPKGSAEKFDYDPQFKLFKLNKVMPSGMVFPYDFGFIPNTKGEMATRWMCWCFLSLKRFPAV